MTCDICRQRYALAAPVSDKTGLLQQMCIECAAKHGRPAQFPEGTQRNGRMPPATDFTDNERDNQARLLELHTAQRDALAHCLAAVLHQFRREITGGYSTPEQQQAYRDAKAMLAEVGL